MDERKKVLLIGVGLIGGSVALAIKKEHDAIITGYDVKLENCKLAKKLHIIDEFTADIQHEAEQSDLIILACPVDKTENFLNKLVSFQLKPTAIVTDVGSTKSLIMEKAEKLFCNDVTFIGGHPMAGSHKVGPGSARAHLFENAFDIFTPSSHANGEKLAILQDWLRGTKANFITMDPQEHDLVTGVVSHFPHIIAASLVRQVENYATNNEHINFLAAGGFRDITRIASSSPEMWSDIVGHNKHTLLSLLDAWSTEMEEVKQLINDADMNELNEYFRGAKTFRDSLPVRAKGAIAAFHDLYVDVLDIPGVISHVTTILAEANISITNIRIIEAREDVYGVLRLSFQSLNDLERARFCLENEDYQTFISM